MCGFTGFFTTKKLTNDWDAIISKMRDQLAHRGPDSYGNWLDKESGVAFGHRRLSIIDLSKHGHQPMLSHCSRYVIAFNGEIYNYLDIKATLEKQYNQSIKWRGHSDVEVFLEAIVCWGIEKALKQTNGMFAFALWDKAEKILHLARDRIGEKPLYYGWQNNSLIFGSELKALKAFPEWKKSINRDSICLLLRHNYIPAPHSIYKETFKLLPGTFLSINANQLKDKQNKITCYWSLVDKIKRQKHQAAESNNDIEELDSLLTNSVKNRMIADVPVGAFLSGGIDSSTIVALMQKSSMSPIKTFSIGFNEDEFNEATYAKAVASHLNTDHTELYLSQQDAINIIPKLPEIYDEPFSDSSQLPTFLLSELTKKHVKVSLSGDGGDELFLGYKRYSLAQTLEKKIFSPPRFVRTTLANLINITPDSILNVSNSLMTPFAKKFGSQGNANDKLKKLAELLTIESKEELYFNVISHWKNPDSVVKNSTEPKSIILNQENFISHIHFLEWMGFIDAITYLPDDILVKVDRASMANSLEARVPMLDHEIVEFAQQIPLSLKVKQQHSKWILKQVLKKHMPNELIDRPKMGFSVPIDQWLRSSLKNWAYELLNEQKIKEQGIFNAKLISQKWQEHLANKRNWKYDLWNVLMFQAWLEQHHSQ